MKILILFSKMVSFIYNGIILLRKKFIMAIKNFFKDIKKRGKEHLTVMFIPHSEKRVLTFHISYFTIMFILFLFIAGATFSTIVILSHTANEQEVSNLVQKSKMWNRSEKIIKFEIEKINENIDSLKPVIEDLYSIASSDKGEKIDLWAKGGISEDSNNTNIRKLSLPDEIYDLKSIKNDIRLTHKYIDHIKNYVEEREKLFSKLPSVWPLKVGGYITSDYGWRRNPFNRRRMEWHKGIDIASWPGAPIVATADGVVVFAGWRGGYGLTVIVKHEYGFETHYAHLSRIGVRNGRNVKRGEVVGYLGRTGYTTGYHLHYEVRIGLKDVNPWPYIMNIK